MLVFIKKYFTQSSNLFLFRHHFGMILVVLGLLLLDANGTSQLIANELNQTHLVNVAGAVSDGQPNSPSISPALYEINSNNFSSLDDVVLKIGDKKTTLRIDSMTTLKKNLTIPDNITLHIFRNGYINQGPYSLTINGSAIIEGSIQGMGNLILNGPCSMVGDVNNSFRITVNGRFSADAHHIFPGSAKVTFASEAIKEIYPEWWGAKADGKTDCTSAFNLACAASRSLRSISQMPIPVVCSNSPRGYIAAGPIQVHDIVIRGNNTLFTHIGSKNNMLFQVASTSAYHNTRIEGFDFRSSSSSSTGKCIVLGTLDGSQLAGGLNVEVCNNSWYRYSGTAIYARWADSMYIHHNHFVEGLNGYAIQGLGDVETGIAASSYVFNGVTIRDNRINSHDRYTKTGFPAIAVDGTSVTIDGNMIINSTYGAIKCGYRSTAYNIAITNNYMEGNGPYHVLVGEKNSAQHMVRGLKIENNRMAGGIVDGYMINAIVLNAAHAATIYNNFINYTAHVGVYYGYSGKAIVGNQLHNKNVSIQFNDFQAEDAYLHNAISLDLKKSEGFELKIAGRDILYEIPFGNTKVTDKTANTTITDTYTFKQYGKYQVDLMVYGNGINDTDMILGSWIVMYRYHKTTPIAKTQVLSAAYTPTSTITSLLLSDPIITGSDSTVTATLMQVNNAAARFYWHVRMIMPIPGAKEN